MKLSGDQIIPASQEAVYDAMLDPETLKGALPGCEALEEIGPNEYKAAMTIGVAMIKGKYDGHVKITDAVRPESFTMHIEGKGPQGQISGVGTVRFEAVSENETKVIYDGDATVRGMLARIGARVVQPAANMIVGKFFTELAGKLG
ncbi:MAG: carbon monoxide dehydrogenase subunit G [Thermomicrobiales bacterium]|nr:carbon monoxide dehydrogenase subunit G [Thermomicrobiales bacterium]